VDVYIGEARSSDVDHYSRVPSKDLEGRATKKKYHRFIRGPSNDLSDDVWMHK